MYFVYVELCHKFIDELSDFYLLGRYVFRANGTTRIWVKSTLPK